MPFAEDSYTGNGSTKEFNISFAYIEEGHIKVALNEVATTAFTVDTSTSPKKVVMNTLASETSTQTTTGAPKSGVAVLVFRDTPLNNALVDYTDGSTLIADDLDKSNQQFLFLLQEQDDEQAANISHGLAGHDAKNDQIINVADPTAAQHAATKNYVDTNFQPLDAELTELATMSSGTASALADLTQTEAQILDGATVTTSELNTLDGITASTSELNKLDGVTASTAELNKLDGVTSTTAELNILDGVTATAAEINTLDGITANTAELNKLDGVTASTAEINKLDGLTPTTAELNFVDGVTSAIQNQINGKQPLDAELTELATMPATTASALADLTQAEVQVLDGATLSTAELNTLDGITATAAELNVLDGSSATTADLNKLSAVSATSAELNKLDGITSSTSELNILDGVTATAAELNVADGITASTAELNQLDGKTISSTLTPANTNDIPTSSAVNTFVSGLLNALGGFVAIANENSFPTTNPDPSDNAGTVVSIADAGGMSVNSSGVGSGQTTAGTAVTITGFPSTFNSTTIQAGLGLQVQTTSTLNTYTYHKVYAKDEDVRQLSQDVDDFKARYRVGDSNPTTDLDSGDLFFNRGTGKMLVYNGQNTAWEEVQSIGEFFINTLSASSSTGGGSATFNGTAYRFTLSNAPTNAEQLMVSVNGVVQKPNSGTSQPSEGFAIDGSDIIFAAAPATGATFFITTIGSAVNIGTPSAGTVGTTQLATSAVTNDKVSSSAAIAQSKLDLSITNAEVSASAAIASSKLAKPIDFADNEKARFGTGNDLEIYHDGSNSVVKDNGTGKLILDTDGTAIEFQKAGLEVLAKFNTDGASELYYDNVKKFETKSDGIDVTGEVQCDSLDVDGNVDIEGTYDGTVCKIKNNRGSASTDGGLEVETSTTAAKTLSVKNAGTERFYVKGDGTAYFNSNVGLGVTSPTERLHLSGNQFFQSSVSTNTTQNTITFRNTIASGYTNAQIEVATDSQYWTGNLLFRTASASNANILVERMRVRSNGDVILGKYRAPNTFGTVADNKPYELKVAPYGWANGSEIASISMGSHGGTGQDDGQIVFKTAENVHSSATGLQERVRILSNGGLTFNGDTAQANALDDYEEGTWTPAWGGTNISGGGTGITSVSGCTYVKIGKLVLVRGRFSLSGTTGNMANSDGFYLTGLPYNNTENTSTGSWWSSSSWTSGTRATGIAMAYTGGQMYFGGEYSGGMSRGHNRSFAISYYTSD